MQDVVANGVADEHGVPPRRTTKARSRTRWGIVRGCHGYCSGGVLVACSV
ncbi:hypothetical protein BN2537_3015 [Streptomyces venezuelae]|nr:hypothetical protein BN2537_3015 [Streptomyces venezuelae]